MRFALPGLFALSVAMLSPEVAFAKCGDNVSDLSSVAATRAEVEAQCPCAAATSHRAYVACARGVADQAVAASTLPRQCRMEVIRCARKSTCGNPGAVTCCRTNAKGVTRCSIKRNAARCTPPRNGSACLGMTESCCGACLSTGCAVTPTPTPPPTPTPTDEPTPTAEPTPPYGSASQAFILRPKALFQ